MIESLQDLVQLSEDVSNPHIERWKQKGGKVVGYLCTYVPEELIYAAGMLPVRVRAAGNAETTLGDVYFSSYNCTFTRHCLHLALSGGYDFLDGMIAFNSCDQVKRVFEVWSDRGNVPYFASLSVPHGVTENTLVWYEKELGRLKAGLENHFEVEITDEKLRDAITMCNESRVLLKQLYELRKGEAPPVSGADVLGIAVASTAMPKQDFNRHLKDLLPTLAETEGISEYRARLMLVGGLTDDPSFVQTIEDLGGLIVTDSLCFGTRYFWDLVEESESPMRALAKRYLEHSPCPRMTADFKKRFQFIQEQVERFSVDGVICERLKFCDFWAAESALLRHSAEEVNMPLLILEREHLLSGVGQLATRVQAFLEMIEE